MVTEIILLFIAIGWLYLIIKLHYLDKSLQKINEKFKR